jgi:hypothetical protein
MGEAKEERTISTRIFTRFYIPLILSLLVLAFVFVLIRTSPGLSEKATASVLGRRASTNYS